MLAIARSRGLNTFSEGALMCSFASTPRASWHTHRMADLWLCCRFCGLCQKRGNTANGELSCMVKTHRLRAGCAQYERAPARFNKPTEASIAGRDEH
jgi:hypothetical protein